MNIQLHLPTSDWIEVKDGNDAGRALFREHYTYQHGGKEESDRPLLYVGPGFKLVLVTPDAQAICAWRWSKLRADGQTGIECCIFRREAGDVASSMLGRARELVWLRWPGQRLFTFVDPREVRPTWRAGRPTWGHCFYQDGWVFEGLTKKRLHILARYPDGEAAE